MRSDAVSPALGSYTGYLLRRAYAKSAQGAQACIGEDTKLREVAVLSVLADRGPLSQRALGDLMHVNRSVMVKLVDAIEDKGWVVRARNIVDRRSYALELTTSGKDALADLHRDLERGDETLTARLSQRDRERLNALLRKLLEGEEAAGVAMMADLSGYLIALAHRRVREHAIEKLEPLGVDPRDFGVLAIIAGEQPCSQQHLADSLGVSAPAALLFVDGLEEAGMVTRSRSHTDRRVHDLALTPAGAERLTRADAVAHQVQADVVERLGARGDRRLRALLTQLLQP